MAGFEPAMRVTALAPKASDLTWLAYTRIWPAFFTLTPAIKTVELANWSTPAIPTVSLCPFRWRLDSRNLKSCGIDLENLVKQQDSVRYLRLIPILDL